MSYDQSTADLLAENKKLKATITEYEENIKYLLDSTEDVIHCCYKGGPENLIDSLAINYINLRDAAGRRK